MNIQKNVNGTTLGVAVEYEEVTDSLEMRFNWTGKEYDPCDTLSLSAKQECYITR